MKTWTDFWGISANKLPRLLMNFSAFYRSCERESDDVSFSGLSGFSEVINYSNILILV